MVAHNVLFICTHNSARSIFAEAILNYDAGGRFQGFSAGSDPGAIHPAALDVLETFGHDTSCFRSKSWSEFASPNAPIMDFVFTLCDTAAGENCPLFSRSPITAHWGIHDPAADTQDVDAFVRAYGYIQNRITGLLALSIDSLDELATSAALAEIGRSSGATDLAMRRNAGQPSQSRNLKRCDDSNGQ